MEKREFEKVLAAVGQMSAEQTLLLADQINLASKSSHDIEEVYRLIERRFEAGKKCPHCGNTRLQRCGKRSRLQRWTCVECNRSFNALTGTPTARLRKKEQWLEFAKTLTQSLTVRKAADVCEISNGTSFLWRHRFLENEKQAKCQELKGIAEADETFFLESFKGQRSLPRPPRKRGGKAKKRGLSKEQIPVLIARDRYGNHIDGVLPDRSKASVRSLLKGPIAPDAMLCSDTDAATIAFAKDENIRCETFVASKGQHVVDGVVHVQNVNAYIRRLKQWIDRFNGVATKYLASYIGWRRMLDLRGHSLTPKSCLLSALG